MKAEDKVYETYLKLNKNELYFNQLKEITKLSNSSLQNVLNKFVKEGILELNKTKSNTFYKIKNKKIFSLKFSEIAVNKFNNLNLSVRVPLKNFLRNISNEIYTIVLFGSSSKKEEQRESDIDLLVVTNKKVCLMENKKEAEITSKYPVSIFQTTINEFIENKDDVVIQAKKTGFPIYKEQNFYEAILNEY
jgi:predicted nucleotidyltransferase